MNASRAFLSSWRSEQIPPSSKLGWDHYAARVARCSLFREQYDNRAYDSLQRLLDLNNGRVSLYQYTRGVTNPVTRIVDLYPALCAGGAIDFDSLKIGAIPVMNADDTLRAAIIQVLLWSNWSIEKSTYVRNGALTGDTVVKCVNYPKQRKVSAEIIPSDFVKEDVRDNAGNVKSYVIEYDLEEEVSTGRTQTYTYREECDKEWFRTFKDGKPFGFVEGEHGEPVSEWPNPYGFVPMVIVPHKRMSGLRWGVNSYYHTIPKIDNMNDLASALDDYLRRAMAPSWLANFDKPKPKDGETKSNIDLGVSKRDQERIIYAPESAKMQSLVHPVDVPAAMQYIEYLDDNITKDCPETSLPQLRAGGNLTAPGVQAAFKDGEGRIMEAQANYDNGTVRFVQMLITMAAVHNYDGFSAYNKDSFDRGNLGFYIKPRPIIEDKLSKVDELSAWQQSGIDQKVWELLGATEEEINQFKLEKQQKAMFELMMKQQQNPTLPTAPNAPAQLPSGEVVPATPTGKKLPTDQALDTSHLTDDHLNSLFDEFQQTRGKVK